MVSKLRQPQASVPLPAAEGMADRTLASPEFAMTSVNLGMVTSARGLIDCGKHSSPKLPIQLRGHPVGQGRATESGDSLATWHWSMCSHNHAYAYAELQCSFR